MKNRVSVSGVRYILLAVCIVVIPEVSLAQQYRGPQDYTGALQVPLPYPDRYPPIRPDMPAQIQQDILFVDSIVRSVYVPHGGLDSMMAFLTDVEQLKDIIKRLYEIDDYDPIAYLQLLHCEPNGKSDPKKVYASTAPNYVINTLLIKADELLADSGLSVALAKTHLILQVTVLDTLTVEHLYHGHDLARSVRVTCRIDDIFKGRRIPSCLTGIASDSIPNVIQSAAGDCFQFEYSTNWAASPNFGSNPSHGLNRRNGSDDLIILSDKGPPPPWIFPGEKFILFADLTANGSWRGHEWASAMPNLSCSTQKGLYRIKDGKVIDLNNDFGFGNDLSIEDFKTKLREKIQKILN